MERETNGADAQETTEKNEQERLEENVEATAQAVFEEAAKAAEEAAKATEVDELEKVKAERDEARDRALRALAELENFRARSNRLASEASKYASFDLAKAILPVWDDLGRALEAAEAAPDGNINAEALVDGVKMVYNKFLEVLAQNGVERIEALHKPFDPNFHESIASLPNDEHPKNTVIVETQAGFKLRDRVVRPSQVVLAVPSQPAQ
ncbi:MAG: nucleotide exchange factor GrpE [Thermoguttaceae bacterium]|nr:nucleotide exchange factor GrpE [Thermoguttaceae bacterium]